LERSDVYLSAMTLRARPLVLALALLASAVAALPASAQATRSTEIGAPAPKDGEITIGRYVFAGIGIDHYQTPELWKPLENAVNDVRHIRETLQEGFAFESPEPWLLLDSAATKDRIEELLDDLANTLQETDNLVFFYAGHGAERSVEVGDRVRRSGYLVPVEASKSLEHSRRDYILIADLLERLSELRARHVLVILDSCYSGMALEGELKTRGGPQTRLARDLMGQVSRRVLTSAQADQLAADGGDDFPNNSLFTGWLAEGLRIAAAGGSDDPDSADSDSNGLITASELFTFVRGRVSDGAQQTPDFGAFQLDQSGELVLMLDRDPFQIYYREAIDAYDTNRPADFFASATRALEQEVESPESSHLLYLLSQEKEDLPNLLRALRELAAFADAGAEVPLAGMRLARELDRVEKLCAGDGCTVEGNAP
jgi:uncharacterized caspase-like protein